MRAFAELVISLCDLCEAEGRLLQESIFATVRRLGLLLLGLLFGAAALALLLAALYAFLSSFLSAQAVLASLGAACALIALFLLWLARCLDTAARGKTKTKNSCQAKNAPPQGSADSPVQVGREGESKGIAFWDRVTPYGGLPGTGIKRG